ncbi:MAG: hypothetical protein HKN69_14945 [Desulfofustis sp.]|nr:hypothetical protein [Desulfofustis sp.]
MQPSAHKIRTLAISILLFSVVFTLPCQAQDMPSTQIWLLPLVEDQPGEPSRISQESGYNNQPHFSPDSKIIYFTAEQEGGQTDVWQYEISSGALTAVNHSPESEYSPTPISGQNAVSVVRVETDQRQRLWRIDLANGEASLLMPNVEPVGYHAWIDDRTAVLFILGESMTLHRGEIGDKASVQLADNIGRTLRRHPSTGEAIYVDKNLKPWRIAAFNFDSGASRQIMPLFPGIEDFDLDSRGRFWAGSGSKIYRSNVENTRWNMLVDLKDYRLKNISRLAVSPDGNWLAIVVSP